MVLGDARRDEGPADEFSVGPSVIERDDSPIRNAILGTVVTVVTLPILVSPVVGGIAAAYLERGDIGTGIKIGGMSGFFALVPLFVVGFVHFSRSRLLADSGFLELMAVLLFESIFLALYVVGLGMLGGMIGASLTKIRS